MAKRLLDILISHSSQLFTPEGCLEISQGRRFFVLPGNKTHQTRTPEECAEIRAPFQGARSARTLNQGFRSLRSLNPWLVSQHPSGVQPLGGETTFCLPSPLAVKTTQYNGVFYVYSIGLLKRSIPALDGSYRSRHSRYDRRRDGFSAHSVLRVEAEGFTYNCRDDHCVVLCGSTYFSAIMGSGIGSLRPTADSFDQSVCIDGCVLRIRCCECDVAIVPVPDCARSWRRHHGCSSSIRQ